MDSNSEMLQALHEHGILDHNANSTGSSSKEDGGINIHLLWELYKKVSSDLQEKEEVHNREMHELQDYVASVRSLSEERDRLTMESDRESHALKQELKRLEEKQAKEEQEILEMLYQENLSELIGQSRNEQIAYLLMFRTTLTDKLEATEKVMAKHSAKLSDLDHQLHDLRSEDSELRDRMNNAMSEMGGMANKLNMAVQERDRLKREVSHLSQTLAVVNALPSQNINNMEAKTQIEVLQSSVNYYMSQIERLTTELESCKNNKRSREAELNAELEEMREMNARFKDVNMELNDRLNISATQEIHPETTKRSTSVDSYLLPESQERLQVKSQNLIDQMQAALESEEKQAEVHRDEMKKMEEKIKHLEDVIKNKDEQLKHEQETRCSEMEFKQLQAQLAETDRQYKEAKAEGMEFQEKYHAAERDAAKSEAAWNRCQKQLNTQTDVNFELKQRNAELEIEFTKFVNQIETTNEKANRNQEKKNKVEEKLKQNQKTIEELETEMQELRRTHEKEMREVESTQNHSPADYISSESALLSELQIDLTRTQIDLEKEKVKRLTMEEDLESVRFELEFVKNEKDELSVDMESIQKKSLSLADKLQMMSGKYEDIQGEKIIGEMSRQQLEDLSNVLSVRLMSAFDKLYTYSEKYRSLKQKHKGKIRKIRDLFKFERVTTAEEIEKLELRVILAESALERELEWKQEAINEVKRAEEEQRKAIKREYEMRKHADDRNNELSLALDKNKDLNDENEKLQSQLSHLEQQKHEMERLVRKANQKKELSTLLSSLSLSGSFPRQSDALISNDTMETVAMETMAMNRLDSGIVSHSEGEELSAGGERGKMSIKSTDL